MTQLHSDTSRARLWARCAAVVMGVVVLSVNLWAPVGAYADDVRDREYWLDASNIRKAWEISQGEGVKVAVIDTGINGDVDVLKGAVVGGTDVSGAGAPNGQEPLGPGEEQKQHGTMVASLLAGRGVDKNPPTDASATPDPNQVGAGPDGVIGVAPKAELLSISLWVGPNNPGGLSIEEQIPVAVKYAVDQGAKVINMSLGSNSTTWPQSWDEAFKYAEDNDVVIVAAAGNRDSGITQVGAPATIPGVLAVGGLDKNGKASEGSSSQGISISITAPAEELVGVAPNGITVNWQGTSGAAPLVSGAAALIRSKYPDMSAAQVIQQLICGAKDGVGCQSGKPDPIYGYGKLDVYQALTMDAPKVDANPIGSMSEWIRLHRRNDTPPPTDGNATPNPGESSAEIPQAQVPTAIEPESVSGVVPGAVVIGFGALVFLVLVGGTWHIVATRKKLAAAGADSGAPDGAGHGAHVAGERGETPENPGDSSQTPT
ncbi:S8 family serine peptidase [Haematomicrobium sanguinis]|uniref:S8 family serine peptidase n=1 Tax=Haematomicrobium sanguinis TaxID=479106 RepID=UPI001F0B5014|nr:S8 family serine peptidase [Haematomicrobium sanguinis]